MSQSIPFQVIARIHTDFPTKFGIPRQSGLVDELTAHIVFEPEFRDPSALRGLDGYTHLWLLWHFSEVSQKGWSPTVRPPRLGGNTRMGVFATRSPFRPNPIGLSSVRLTGIDLHTAQGPVIQVAGADLMDGTPILDIKPYLPYVDCHCDATGGFSLQSKGPVIQVNFPPELLALVPSNQQQALIAVLAQDPRPAYQNDPTRVYGMDFAGLQIHFTADQDCLTVCRVECSS